MTHGILPLPIVAVSVVVFVLIIALIQRLRPLKNMRGDGSDLTVILLALVLTAAVVISFVAAADTALPTNTTGYDYEQAEKTITDPWDMPNETPTTTATTTTIQEGKPVLAEFRVESPDPGIEFPIVVTFERKEQGNWTQLTTFNVSEGEAFIFELQNREWYRITATDTENDVCGPMLYQAIKTNSNHTLIINNGHVKSC